MASFFYSGRDISGQRSGQLEAKTKKEAAAELRGLGLVEFRLEKTPVYQPVIFHRWLDALNLLLEQNLQLIDAIRLLAKQSDKKLAMLSEYVVRDIELGNSFCDAVFSRVKAIQPTYIAILSVAESTGGLASAINKITIHHARINEQRSQMRAQMTYPLFLIIVLMICLYALLDVVAPSLKQAIGEREITNWASRWVFAFAGQASLVFQFITLTLFSLLALVWFGTRSQAGSAIVHRFPLVARIFEKRQRRLGLEVMSLAIDNHVSAQKAAEIVDEMFLSDGGSISAQLKEGKSLPLVLKEGGYLTNTEWDLISLGASDTGLNMTLNRIVALRHKEDFKKRERLKLVMGPLLILLVGGMVAIFAFAILSPIMEMTKAVGI